MLSFLSCCRSLKRQIEILYDKHISIFQMPKTVEEWKEIATEFELNWNFNNCIGAIDGKHVHINKPAKSGSLYFNYKKVLALS